jgi:hypothetical protein
MNRQTETAASAFPLFPATPMLANGQKFFLAAARLQVNAYQALMRYQIETLGFLKHRCEQDAKLAEDLVASDEFKDAFDIVGNFVENAASDYAAEVGKVASIGSKLASETAKRVRKEADGAIKDQAAKTVAA